MPDDTPQQMINARKRKLQPQAVDDPFIAEMKAAEAKGDLPPARGRYDHMEGAEIVGGGEGKIQLTSPEAQAAAVDLYQDSMKTTGGPHMGVEAEDYRSRDKLRNLEEEFPLKGRVGEEDR